MHEGVKDGAPFDPESVVLAGETITVDSFVAARRLRMYRETLESGLPEHARANMRLRDEWGLGDVVVAAAPATAADKVGFPSLIPARSFSFPPLTLATLCSLADKDVFACDERSRAGQGPRAAARPKGVGVVLT